MRLRDLFLSVITDIDTATIDFESYKAIECPYEVNPATFLAIAEEASARGGLSGRIDCLSNSKRAVDCQIDTILTGCGLRSLTIRNKFPGKIEMTSKLGLVAPGIVNRLNQYRNLMEHEYIAPAAEKVADFHDVASLFVSFCSAKLQLLNEQVYLQQAADPNDQTKVGQCIVIDYSETEKARINVTAHAIDSQVVGQIQIKPIQKDLYVALLRGMFVDPRNIVDTDADLLCRRLADTLLGSGWTGS